MRPVMAAFASFAGGQSWRVEAVSRKKEESKDRVYCTFVFTTLRPILEISKLEAKAFQEMITLNPVIAII